MQAVVLVGAPGSGKGTLAGLLKGYLRVPHVSTGEMLREHMRSGDGLGGSVSAAVNSGTLVSDELVNALVERRLALPDAQTGFILDGYPRTVAQAAHFAGWLDRRGIRELVIHLVVDYNSIVARLAGRRQCPRCGTLYNIVSAPPKVAGVCDLDGEKLVVRDDDSEPVVRERLAAHEEQTRPLLDFFARQGRAMVAIDASELTPQALLERARQAIEAREAGLPAMQA